MNTNAEILHVTCDSNGSWIPNPADFIQSCLPTTSPSIINIHKRCMFAYNNIIITVNYINNI